MRCFTYLIKFFVLILLTCCTENQERTEYYKSTNEYELFVTNPEELNQLTYRNIKEKYGHNFCDSSFKFLATINSLEQIELEIPHPKGCCLCLPEINRLGILINKQNEVMIDNVRLNDLNSIRRNVDSLLNVENYTNIQIKFDTLCTGEFLFNCIEQTVFGHYDQIQGGGKHQLRLSVIPNNQKAYPDFNIQEGTNFE